ncbi:acetaldehyde dehydrogenase (acetylating) [Desulfoscipio geothermicus]|uniref:Acetaldehyde dehydrogenase n=1 Tax=Desulfoscipio geothermicus DSM 3669 TaxID=1121426 RepID=A0A1I6DR42_9FIRM|nr:acetaldehyde dehydrogenase (acetylating) [Desulfoscipio geothermicus]SFR07828.1 acetaldehyde dehydrogenase [Desulfoscipio geothermicus DSM 3669]
MEKVKAAIVGPGNIGTDLMYKLLRSKYIEAAMMVGIYPESEGLARAKSLGIKASHEGINAVLQEPDIKIVFDSTGAKPHLKHAPLLREAGKIAIDLTPAAVGPYVVPAVNVDEHLEAINVNMVTCGGQATVPIVAAINRVAGVQYAEIIASLASKSAGPGTRQNIDEFTETTSRALEIVGGAKKGKAIIILNPADPPIMMHNTIYTLVKNPDEELIRSAVHDIVRRIQEYVPGYHLRVEPFVEGNKVTTIIEVTGAGDFLPTYAGNLDIMTSAAVRVGELMAMRLLGVYNRKEVGSCASH